MKRKRGDTRRRGGEMKEERDREGNQGIRLSSVSPLKWTEIFYPLRFLLAQEDVQVQVGEPR